MLGRTLPSSALNDTTVGRTLDARRQKGIDRQLRESEEASRDLLKGETRREYYCRADAEVFCVSWNETT